MQSALMTSESTLSVCFGPFFSDTSPCLKSKAFTLHSVAFAAADVRAYYVHKTCCHPGMHSIPKCDPERRVWEFAKRANVPHMSF